MKKLLYLFILILIISNIYSIEFTLAPYNDCSDAPITLVFTVSDFSPDELNYVGINFDYYTPISAVSHSCTGLPTESWFQSSDDDGSSFIFAASDLSGSALISEPCTLAIINLGIHSPGENMRANVSLINYEFEGAGSTEEYSLTGFVHPNFLVQDCGTAPCSLNTIVTATDSLVCSRSQTDLYADAGAYSAMATYSWEPAELLDNPNSANPIATPESSTVFVVETRVSVDCTDTDSILISVMPPIELNLNDTIFCHDEFVQLGVENIYESYLWSTGDINFRINFMSDFTNDSLFWLEVSDVNGCTMRDSLIVRTNPCPDCDLVFSAVAETTICRGESISILADAGALQDRCFYRWEPELFISDPRTDVPVFNPDTTIEYTVHAMYSPVCYDSAKVKINVYPEVPLVFPFEDTTVCSERLLEFSSPGEYYSYEWDHNPAETGSSYFILTDFDSQYIHLTVYDSTGCSDSDSFLVTTVSCEDSCNLIADMVPDTFICRGDYIDLWAISPSESLSYRWIPAEGVNDPYSAFTYAIPETSSIFTLIATDPGVCSDTGYVEIRVGPEIEIDIGELIECRNDSVPLWAPEGFVHYVWSTGEVTRGVQIYTDFTSREFWVRAIDQFGCMESDTFVITTQICDSFQCNIDVSIRTKLDSLYICRGDSVELDAIVRNAEGDAVYSWEPETDLIHSHLPNAIVFPSQTTTYIVTVEDDSLCVAMDTITINVVRCRPGGPVECLAHPKPFTPNSDGINDILYFRYPEMNEKDGIVYIYNLNNVLVRQIEKGEGYSNSEGAIIWDGKDNNENYLQNGPYLYVLKIGDETVCKGTVYLAR